MSARRVVTRSPGAVVALGAGHTSYTDPAHGREVARVLAACPDVRLVLPCQDRDAAYAVLRRRCLETKGTTWTADGHDFLARWLDEPLTRQVATGVVLTAGSTPQHTARAVAASLAPSAAAPTVQGLRRERPRTPRPGA
ncbi:hypothetical protein CLV28_1694 [Sediminihabitans luteus]|uniref:Shikimate kinase n=1 Tax=Sediminihabitans luteus TaxID=1138585 RepID=A0A2M9CQI7_9CELL|nr:hypothetical protein [Sediminihabitans luteus]PJJ74200.1 hypothetical protein CLV28_1694 [Sediminihabitans luteus]GII99053.1 hypothetical protein Slu03_14310 [Sediminihabitans luteus]